MITGPRRPSRAGPQVHGGPAVADSVSDSELEHASAPIADIMMLARAQADRSTPIADKPAARA